MSCWLFFFFQAYKYNFMHPLFFPPLLFSWLLLQVYLYLKAITNSVYCASFDILREFQVSNIQPVESMIFEYYHPELLGQSITEFNACETLLGDANLDSLLTVQASPV